MARDTAIDRRTLLAGATIAAALGSGAAFAQPANGNVPAAVWQRISDVLQNYADSLDRADAEAFGAVFTIDGVFDYKPDTVIRGRPALIAAARAIATGAVRSSHHVGPPVVTAGERPGQWRARSYFSAHHLLRTGKRLELHGRYEDVFAADEAGTLLIAYRKVIGHVAQDGMEDEARYWLRPLPRR